MDKKMEIPESVKSEMVNRLRYLEQVYSLAYTSEGHTAINDKGCGHDWTTFTGNTESEINALRGLLGSKEGRCFNGRL